ncbi:hypothetical protein [Psychroserpens algicola]|uniref:PH domain-containing protein n=1 Tax=Psychroserpens algicola TaxID=1719034 RepID=A0ABT0H8H3_9FLAO|nr:hypothetical protein [Psychroserpens algicola]MCK8480663.1 hypothetical protein [Psychroserpens algicola]
MRTNNSKVKNTIISVYFMLIVLAITFLFVFRTFTYNVANPMLLFIGIALGFALLFFLVHFVSKFFEYDSDGLKVVITNRGLLFSDKFNYREHILEFDKNELYAFKFKNYFFYKTLTFYLKNSKGKKTVETFNTTLVNRRKRRYIRQSLSKIIKANKKALQNNE